ncbi:hypothetical protein BRETT_001434 [Brettanomyces bruxellensis]|uniref:Uncharacterized protein n=1 Tax=Dekkera bruxellensis TaxID=5007 RepID=A0A871RD67_DEKBR|nr:uncharacterized protein BRETT_001434 [Brettanomyces bruxellensis]QOU21708.1 hypothetical protein BRETT_001434 [Brettanomyces bruxellensis]
MPSSKKSIQRSLRRTSLGRIASDDLKDIYSSLIYCLKLKEERSKSLEHASNKILSFSFGKAPLFSFCVGKALCALENLSFDVHQQSLTTNISYDITKQSAFNLLTIFFDAHLLHCPEDRTKNLLPGKNKLVQVTPKGAAVFQRFCEKKGILSNARKVTDLLESNINTMQLVYFERNPETDRIIHNEYWDKLLFVGVMGPRMNFWSPKNPPDEIPDEILNSRKMWEDIASEAKFGNYIFDGYLSNGSPGDAKESQANFQEYLDSKNENKSISEESGTSKSSGKKSTKAKKMKKTSEKYPFYHRFFSNPDSDSHIQYYVSNKGVRLFRNKTVYEKSHKDRLLSYCVTGQAIVQYLMDCTDIMYIDEALGIGETFMQLNLLEKAYTDDKLASHNIFSGTKHDFYKLSDEGKKIVHWKRIGKRDVCEKVENEQVSSSEPLENRDEKEEVDSLQADGSVHSKFDNCSCGEDGDAIKLKTMRIIPSSPSVSVGHFSSDSIFVDCEQDNGKKASVEQQIKGLTLSKVLKDPALKYLFRQHLFQSYCEENLDAYDAIGEFESKLGVLKKLVKLRRKQKLDASSGKNAKFSSVSSKRRSLTVKSAISRVSKECLSKIYAIYSSYLIDGVMNELNIDSHLKFSIRQLMTSPDTPSVFKSFPTPEAQRQINTANVHWLQKMDSKASSGSQECSKTPTEKANGGKAEDMNNEAGPKRPPNIHIGPRKDVGRSELSPSDIVMAPTLSILWKVGDLYGQVRTQVRQMLEQDSLPKFLGSDTLYESMRRCSNGSIGN